MTAAVILPNQMIDGAVLSLASNIAPEVHLSACRQTLATIGKMTLSDTHQSTCQFSQENAQTLVAPYHNQIMVLVLNHAMPYAEFWQLTKQLERENGRQACVKPNVTLDIDILAVQIAAEQHRGTDRVFPQAPSEKAIQRGNWRVLARRLPLAEYDKLGAKSLPPDGLEIIQAIFLDKV